MLSNYSESTLAPAVAIKGRGAVSNPVNRYHAKISVLDVTEDGFNKDKKSDQTDCLPLEAKTILSKNKSPDVPFDVSINPYSGCEHGCIYCYARPTHAYHDLSPGLDFETKIFAKENAAELLKSAFSKKGYVCKPINLGANTDPYQPIEAQKKITRQLLEVFLQYKHPVTIITKGNLILRDLDLLQELAQQGLCSVRISVTTLDNKIKRTLEPRAASAEARFKVIQELAGAGVPTGLLLAPVIPSINDHEIERIVGKAAANGAVSAEYILLRLPLEVKQLFQDWLTAHYPNRAKHVLSLISQSRGGKLYDSGFSQRMKGTGVFADMLAKRFTLACKKHGLKNDNRELLNHRLFEQTLTSIGQMSLF